MKILSELELHYVSNVFRKDLFELAFHPPEDHGQSQRWRIPNIMHCLLMRVIRFALSCGTQLGLPPGSSNSQLAMA